MVSTQFIVGDCFEVLERLAEDGVKVDLMLTSPPFCLQREYLPEGHPDKGKEVGREKTPAEFVDMLLRVVDAVSDVLADHGSIAIELDDKMSGSGGAGGDYNAGGWREGQPRAVAKSSGDGWPLAKSMALTPELFRVALAYGFNPLTGEASPAGQWRVRNVVTWCKPNPTPGRDGDKYRHATSDMVVACRSKTRWFDVEDVRTPFTGHAGVGSGIRKGQNGVQSHDNRPDDMPFRINTNSGAPPLDWWKLSTESYPEAHFATYPSRLLTVPIRSMCPREVCTECGIPRTRIVEPTPEHAERLGSDMFSEHGRSGADRAASGKSRSNGPGNPSCNAENVTVGWTKCDCGAPFRPGVVLDPFTGSGTTLMVAHGLGRSSIGIDLDARNVELARGRLGMFLEVVS